jgi:nitrogen fixation NifU-like protein
VSLDELYRQVILEHYRNPRRRGTLEHPDGHADGHNPLCGDEVAIDVAIADGRVTDVAVKGQGCSISQASASMMADAIAGLTLDEVADLTRRFKVMMEIEQGDDVDPATMGDLAALQGVRRFPVRIKCADLPWVTLADAIADAGADAD